MVVRHHEILSNARKEMGCVRPRAVICRSTPTPCQAAIAVRKVAASTLAARRDDDHGLGRAGNASAERRGKRDGAAGFDHELQLLGTRRPWPRALRHHRRPAPPARRLPVDSEGDLAGLGPRGERRKSSWPRQRWRHARRPRATGHDRRSRPARRNRPWLPGSVPERRGHSRRSTRRRSNWRRKASMTMPCDCRPARSLRAPSCPGRR